MSEPAKAAGIDLAAQEKADEVTEYRTIASRMKIRDKVAEDIEAYLNKGGSIVEVAPDVTADPPRKPESNYGARAI